MIDQVLAFAMFTPSRSLARPLALLLSFSVTIIVTLYIFSWTIWKSVAHLTPCPWIFQHVPPKNKHVLLHARGAGITPTTFTKDTVMMVPIDVTHSPTQVSPHYPVILLPPLPLRIQCRLHPWPWPYHPLPLHTFFLVFCDLSVLKRPSQLSWMVPCNLDLSLHPPARVQGKHFWQEECRHDAAACFPRPHLGGRALWVCPTVRVAIDRLPEICPSPYN